MINNTYTLAILVEDKPTTLSRVVGLFARRGFNIHSLAVGPAETIGISRITIVTDELSAPIEQILSQLRRLIHVLKVEIMHENQSISHEVCLIKIKQTAEMFNSILQIKERYNAQIVDESEDSMTIEITGSGDKITEFISLLEPIGILELVKSGVITLSRGQEVLRNMKSFGDKE